MIAQGGAKQCRTLGTTGRFCIDASRFFSARRAPIGTAAKNPDTSGDASEALSNLAVPAVRARSGSVCGQIERHGINRKKDANRERRS
jgi:hypothetical protein